MISLNTYIRYFFIINYIQIFKLKVVKGAGGFASDTDISLYSN
ncbi:hypothetical protein ACEE21_01545 [Clostridium baratii]